MVAHHRRCSATAYRPQALMSDMHRAGAGLAGPRFPGSRRLGVLQDVRADAEADVQPVEGVDRADQQGELDLLVLAEVRLEVGIDLVGGSARFEPGQRLGPL